MLSDCVRILLVESPLDAAQRAALSRPVVGQQEVLVLAGDAEFKVPQRTAGSVEGPHSHQEEDDVGRNQAGHVLWVLEGLWGTRLSQYIYMQLFSSIKNEKQKKLLTATIWRDKNKEWHSYQTRDEQVADNNSRHGPPTLLLAGVKEDHTPEHVQQDDGHGHES